MQGIVEAEYRQIGKDDLSSKWHTHDGVCEIIQIWTDEGTVLVRDKIYPMQQGMIFFINGMENHCTSPENEAAYQRSKVIVTYEFIKRIADLTGLENEISSMFETGERTCIEMSMENSVEVDRLFKRIKTEYDSDGEYKAAEMVALIIRLITRLCCYANSVRSSSNGKMEKIIRYINNHLSEDIRIDDICSNVYISKYHLCHMFKKETHMTVSQYILQRRLSVARRLLIDTDDVISEVAAKAGFTSFSYFSSVFRNMHGYSPREFRIKERKTMSDMS